MRSIHKHLKITKDRGVYHTVYLNSYSWACISVTYLKLPSRTLQFLTFTLPRGLYCLNINYLMLLVLNTLVLTKLRVIYFTQLTIYLTCPRPCYKSISYLNSFDWASLISKCLFISQSNLHFFPLSYLSLFWLQRYRSSPEANLENYVCYLAKLQFNTIYNMQYAIPYNCQLNFWRVYCSRASENIEKSQTL